MSPDDVAFVGRALAFALERHAAQGAVALLHDVIEDCGVADAELDDRLVVLRRFVPEASPEA